jgi:hypothetical protein
MVVGRPADIFANLEYGPAPEEDQPAQAWLDAHQRKFGHFINNQVGHLNARRACSSSAPFPVSGAFGPPPAAVMLILAACSGCTRRTASM